jgi:16S rRNA A1518/A1519 N6-dimethyltransferase RsmA/KsgA/DIM1 with predicted DNA glycosylase/AP lyase activity
VNALFAVFEKTYNKETISKIVESCGFDTRIRGEVLSIEDFVKLSAALKDRK